MAPAIHAQYAPKSEMTKLGNVVQSRPRSQGMLRVCELFEGPGEVLLRDGIMTKPSLVDDTIVREIRVVRRIRLRNVKVSSDGHLKHISIDERIWLCNWVTLLTLAFRL